MMVTGICKHCQSITLYGLRLLQSTRDCRNVWRVITYICISVQVRFLKNRHFWKIKSSVISSLDMRIRNYYRNGVKQPIHLLTWLVLATMCEQLPFPYPSCPHTRVMFRHSLVERTIVQLPFFSKFFLIAMNGSLSHLRVGSKQFTITSISQQQYCQKVQKKFNREFFVSTYTSLEFFFMFFILCYPFSSLLHL